MKSLNLLIALFTTISLSLSAQIIEKDLRMSSGVQNALVVELNGADDKRSEKIWKSFTKEYGKLQRDKKMDEFFLLDIIIPAIDPEYAVTVFTKFDEYDDMTRASFWFKMDDRFLNSIDDEEEIDGADAFLTDYSIEVEKTVIKDQLDDEEKTLKNFKKDLSKLEKKNQDLLNDIEKAKETIRKAEAQIETNLKDQEMKREEIEGQEKTVDKVSDKMNKVGKNK